MAAVIHFEILGLAVLSIYSSLRQLLNNNNQYFTIGTVIIIHLMILNMLRNEYYYLNNVQPPVSGTLGLQREYVLNQCDYGLPAACMHSKYCGGDSIVNISTFIIIKLYAAQLILGMSKVFSTGIFKNNPHAIIVIIPQCSSLIFFIYVFHFMLIN